MREVHLYLVSDARLMVPAEHAVCPGSAVITPDNMQPTRNGGASSQNTVTSIVFASMQVSSTWTIQSPSLDQLVSLTEIMLEQQAAHSHSWPVTMAPKRSTLPASSVSPLFDDFASRGWVLVPNFLSPSELQRLQAECSELYTRQSTEAIAAQGCVLDVMAQCPIRDSDIARVDPSCYLKARAKQWKSVNDDEQFFHSMLFEKLPGIVGQLMAGTCSTKSEITTKVFFFNEHYVVKPPKSHVEFRWHRDDDEQLAMCVHRETIRPYVSVWCALDDVTSVNGALQFVSRNVSDEMDDETVESLHHRATAPVTAKAGDVLFFLSNVWHCSSSNESIAPRRAFYAQYSSEKITARPKDVSPLSFAVPCNAKMTGLLVDMVAARDGDRKGTKKVKRSEL